MKKRMLMFAAVVSLSIVARAHPSNGDVRQRLALALDAMGGRVRLASLHSLTSDAIGHTFALEQSQRPEGPWLTTYTQTKEIRDFDRKRIWAQSQRRNWSNPAWGSAQTSISTADGGALLIGSRWISTPPTDVEVTLALEPERVLLTAEAASDLHGLPDEVEQRTSQHVVGFTFHGRRVRLSLNAWTHLPTMLEIVANDPANIWGDVTERRWYSYWTLEKGGLMYPRQTSTEWNGVPRADRTVQGFSVDDPIDDAKFAIPADATATARPGQIAFSVSALAFDETKAVAISDTVVEVSGAVNMALVRQPDGLVVIEAPMSSDYASAAMAFVGNRYPGLPIKALVSTSDAWGHIGGVREFVARGLPIYALDLNVSILTRLANAPHTLNPDALAKKLRAPIFRPVSEKTTLGSGDTRIVLIPVRGAFGERAMIAWLPGQHLLYSSDLIQRGTGGKGFFMPSMLQEVVRAVDGEQISAVDRVFGMHLSPTPWAEVLAAIAEARR